MSSRLFSRDHNTYHRRFRDTWLQREKEATRPFTFQAKAAEMAKNQYKSELLIRSHPRGRGFESLQVHHNVETKKMSPAKSPNISGFFAAQTAIFLCTETQMQNRRFP